jgi:acetoin utilization protein AcuB
MIVSEVMTTKLVTVRVDDTLGHAATLLRQYQFHHLPVVRKVEAPDTGKSRKLVCLLQGMLTSQDIDLAVALAEQRTAALPTHRSWQEQQVGDAMHAATVRVTPTTDLAAAAQLLVERGLNCLPVVEYDGAERQEPGMEPETPPVLVGLLTRSDLLIALARATGAYEPGMQLTLPLPQHDLAPLIRLLQLAQELHIPVRSLIAAPMTANTPGAVSLRLGTIAPAHLLLRLQQEHIPYTFVDQAVGGEEHA